jgi:hypothetical protein
VPSLCRCWGSLWRVLRGGKRVFLPGIGHLIIVTSSSAILRCSTRKCWFLRWPLSRQHPGGCASARHEPPSGEEAVHEADRRRSLSSTVVLLVAGRLAFFSAPTIRTTSISRRAFCPPAARIRWAPTPWGGACSRAFSTRR